MQQILEQIGCRVEAFATTRALDLAEQLCPSLIIVAIELPDRNGIVLREKIRAKRRTLHYVGASLGDSRPENDCALIDSNPHKQIIKFLDIPGEL